MKNYMKSETVENKTKLIWKWLFPTWRTQSQWWNCWRRSLFWKYIFLLIIFHNHCFDGCRLSTIGPTMEWLHPIVEVYCKYQGRSCLQIFNFPLKRRQVRDMAGFYLQYLFDRCSTSTGSPNKQRESKWWSDVSFFWQKVEKTEIWGLKFT